MMLKYLKRTPAWNNWNENIPTSQRGDWQSYRSYWARVDQTLCMMDILWPEFIECEGLILRKSALPENWGQFMGQAKALNWSDSDIEHVINHLHVLDLFMNDPDRDQIEPSVYIYLANTVVDIWRSKLKEKYPSKEFVVGVLNQCEDPEIYFHVARD